MENKKESPEQQISRLTRQCDRLAKELEKMRINDYVELMQSPKRIIYLNFLAGIAKGLGVAVGATIIFALLINLLSQMLVLNLPLISDWIVDIIRIVEQKQGSF